MCTELWHSPERLPAQRAVEAVYSPVYHVLVAFPIVTAGESARAIATRVNRRLQQRGESEIIGRVVIYQQVKIMRSAKVTNFLSIICSRCNMRSRSLRRRPIDRPYYEPPDNWGTFWFPCVYPCLQMNRFDSDPDRMRRSNEAWAKYSWGVSQQLYRDSSTPQIVGLIFSVHLLRLSTSSVQVSHFERFLVGSTHSEPY